MRKLSLYSSLMLFFLSLMFLFPLPVSAADFVVDFTATTGPIKHSGAGFEFGFSNPLPADSVVKPLKPQIFRDFNSAMTKSVYDRVVSLGAIPNVALTDGSCSISPWPGDGGPYAPFAARWEQCVYDRVLAAKNAGMTAKEWEIWAEPDLPPAGAPGYWPNSPLPTSDFLDLWDRSYRAIKRADPNALVAGPSTFEYKTMYTIQFLEHCKAAGTVPDILSWHELYNVFNPVNNFVPANITEHVNHARQVMINNSIPDRKIEITEYIGMDDQYRPGIAVQFLTNFEISKIYGIKGNWVAGHRDNLNELIATPSSTTVRSIWWAYKYYADMTGQLATRNLAGVVDGLATIDAAKREARVLVGNIGGNGPKTISLTRIPSFMLDSKGQLNLLIERIPNTETGDLAAPIGEYGYLTSLTNNSLDLTLPNFGQWEAYSVILRHPGGPAPTPTPTPTPIISSIPTPTPTTIKGDLDANGEVNLLDYFYFVSAFYHGPVPQFINADLNGDGSVNSEDRTIIINALKGN